MTDVTYSWRMRTAHSTAAAAAILFIMPDTRRLSVDISGAYRTIEPRSCLPSRSSVHSLG